MFGFGFKKKCTGIDKKIYSPVNGKCVSIEEVPDKVFASKMMGEGIGFQAEDDMIYAPCDGVITLVADTKHAIGLKADNGAEILIHIGLDTVQLNGKGFHVMVNQNDKVTRGQALVQIDLPFMNENNINLTTPMVITNSSELKIQTIVSSGKVTKDYCVMECEQ